MITQFQQLTIENLFPLLFISIYLYHSNEQKSYFLDAIKEILVWTFSKNY